jgi:hypothetical protein
LRGRKITSWRPAWVIRQDPVKNTNKQKTQKKTPKQVSWPHTVLMDQSNDGGENLYFRKVLQEMSERPDLEEAVPSPVSSGSQPRSPHAELGFEGEAGAH